VVGIILPRAFSFWENYDKFKLMDLSKIKKIHFVGIGGIGVSAVAKMMLQSGKIITGSNLSESIVTQDLEKLGIKIFYQHQAENVPCDADLLVYSPAVPEDNPERGMARKLHILELSYPEFLGEFSKDKFTIAISGTNGKSTTTAILGLILEQAKTDPTVIVGSRLSQWNGNLRLGCSKYFVVEACEWRAHMLNLSPQIIILTNLEEDHLDYYRDLDHIVNTFQQYVDKLGPKDLLILNNDDFNLKKLKTQSRLITYGINQPADIMATNIKTGPGYQQFDLISDKFKTKITLTLKVPGLFNIYNFLAAIAGALDLGASTEAINNVAEAFTGIWRRFEIKKLEINNFELDIIHDYAHHPTAVKDTIQAAREFFPGRRLVVVFQPHHHNRTKRLFNEFVDGFQGAELLMISEIYDVAGREESDDQNVSSQDLVQAIKNKYPQQEVFYTPDLAQTKQKMLSLIESNDVVLIMGAGDIYTLFD
jgi:UDP-N-acetylmuramate--alanine ligase